MIFRRREITGAYWALLVTVIVVSSVATCGLAPSRPIATTTISVSAAAATTTSGTSTILAANASLLGLNPEAIYSQTSPSVVTVEGVQTNDTGNTTILG